ncbi:DUF433 domain-containing protein [Sphingomonas bacterium]|uniref:DUF433 domain-containing protein n=1 Tax=Sphingomonas bacterium TaxID=1895847 RepID=UPI0015750E26|nr:DUF433 domain-containing protein [Sphingomonas bacterium]
MDWRNHIYSDPEIGGGKPIFRGTRFKVDFLLKLMAAGWDAERIGLEYPGLTGEHMRAAIAFAADMLDEESFVASAQARAA